VSCFFSCICIVAEKQKSQARCSALITAPCSLYLSAPSSRCHLSLSQTNHVSERASCVAAFIHTVLLHLFIFLRSRVIVGWNQHLIFIQSAVSLSHMIEYNIQRTHDKSITYSHVYYSLSAWSGFDRMPPPRHLQAADLKSRHSSTHILFIYL
jgi:hypothetical protein